MANPNPPRLASDPETGQWIAQVCADEYLPETVEKAKQGVVLYAQGKKIHEICKILHCSTDTLYNVWLSENPLYNPIVTAYSRARKRRAIAGADQCLDIIDDESRDIHNDKPNSAAVLRDKHRVDTRLRLAAAHDPATYGTGNQVNVNVEINLGERIGQALQRVGEVIEVVDKSVDKS